MILAPFYILAEVCEVLPGEAQTSLSDKPTKSSILYTGNIFGFIAFDGMSD